MTKFIEVSGKEDLNIKIYALSTCGWCKKTKTFFRERGIAFRYVDVDLLSGKEKEDVLKEQGGFNPAQSFPTIVKEDQDVIIGYNEAEMEAWINGGGNGKKEG